MADKKRPLSREQAPDPASSFDRAKPEAESGMGRMDAPKPDESKHADRIEDAVKNKQANRQVNADDVVNTSGGAIPKSGQAAHGGVGHMKEERTK